jgi:hypothetical protein
VNSPYCDKMVKLLQGRKVGHREARDLANEIGEPVIYWPYYPSNNAHTVYPEKKPRGKPRQR